MAVSASMTASAQTVPELKRLSIEDLANLEITSVSKSAEVLSQSPAAVYVITQKDIENEAIISLPDALRLAPSLDVAQTGPSSFNISSRGLSGNASAQNFPNKLLVMIDGRSVYSPLYSGVYWDMQNLVLADVDRIEVISGPGATLWGANAMNGVINVTTRNSAETQGGLLDVSGGNLGGNGDLRYGGRINDDLTYRVYVESFTQSAFTTKTGTNADDGWTSSQAGFRTNWARDSDLITTQGDLYRVDENREGNPVQRGQGGNVVTRWQHEFSADSTLQLQAYYDYVYRGAQGDSGAFHVDTYDVELQNNFKLFDWNKMIFGVGERISTYAIHNEIGTTTSLLFSPDSGSLSLTNAFIEDHLALEKSVDLTLGVKVEDDPYSGVSTLPSARLGWNVVDGSFLWSAVSRAIRSPTPFDTEVIEKLGAIAYLTGDPDFDPERLTAYELGYRGVLGKTISISLSGYWDVYDHLRSIELSPKGGLPLQWGNAMKGEIHGIDAWADIQVFGWWRLSPGFSAMAENLHFAPGASGLLGVAQAGDDAPFRASLRSVFDVSDTVTLNVDPRYSGHRPNPIVAAYAELNAALTWNVHKNLQIYLSGMNLLHAHHVEYDPGDEISRSITAGARWHF